MITPLARPPKTREEIITSMCYTWDHSFGLDKDEWGCGFTPEERDFLWRQMAQLYDNDIAPYHKLLAQETP